jgi:hypothetical protein
MKTNLHSSQCHGNPRLVETTHLFSKIMPQLLPKEHVFLFLFLFFFEEKECKISSAIWIFLTCKWIPALHLYQPENLTGNTHYCLEHKHTIAIFWMLNPCRQHKFHSPLTTRWRDQAYAPRRTTRNYPTIVKEMDGKVITLACSLQASLQK